MIVIVLSRARITETKTQSKGMFSYAMTVMDKIDGWENEEKWVVSKFAASMWIYTKTVLCDGQASTQDFLRRRLLSIVESVNWVCEESFEEHEWVSEHTISMQEEEILEGLDFGIDVPCVVQWGMLWFSAPSRQNQRFEGNGAKCATKHEVTNLALAATFAAPLMGSTRQERAC